jgi:hypothetical protein
VRKLAIELLVSDDDRQTVTVVVPHNVNQLEIAGIIEAIQSLLGVNRSHVKVETMPHDSDGGK